MLKPAFIDLSHHNTIPQSLIPAKDSGILGVIHKVTESTGFVDSKCDNRYILCQDAGLLWGVYHFIRPGNIIRQAEFFVNTAMDIGALDDNTLLCLDYEDASVSLDDCVDFMHKVAEMTGHEPVIYSGHVLKEALNGRPDARLSEYRLWLAQYGSNYVLPPGWTEFWGWQYTESGSCPGINPPVDLNAYWGTADQLKTDWARKIGGDEEDVPVVHVIIQAPPGVEVVVTKK